MIEILIRLRACFGVGVVALLLFILAAQTPQLSTIHRHVGVGTSRPLMCGKVMDYVPSAWCPRVTAPVSVKKNWRIEPLLIPTCRFQLEKVFRPPECV